VPFHSQPSDRLPKGGADDDSIHPPAHELPALYKPLDHQILRPQPIYSRVSQLVPASYTNDLHFSLIVARSSGYFPVSATTKRSSTTAILHVSRSISWPGLWWRLKPWSYSAAHWISRWRSRSRNASLCNTAHWFRRPQIHYAMYWDSMRWRSHSTSLYNTAHWFRRL
jgi:hypothetical protein